MALAAVMTQTLLPKVGGGLVPAAELLMVELRRAPAHPQERAAAPASGDDDHAPPRVVHARGIAGAAGQGTVSSIVRTRSAAPRTSRSSRSCWSCSCNNRNAWRAIWTPDWLGVNPLDHRGPLHQGLVLSSL